MKKLAALLLALAMAFSVAAAEQAENDTIEYAGMDFDGVFNPLFAENPDDMLLAEMTSATMLGLTPYGDVILDGEKGMTVRYGDGETAFYGAGSVSVVENADGTVDYNLTLRDNLVFADGKPADIDDVIFTLYVLADPAYDGPVNIGSLPVIGLAEYSSTAAPLSELMLAAGRDNASFECWSEETQAAFWTDVDAAGAALAGEIEAFILENYLTETYAGNIGSTVAEIEADPQLQLKLGMTMWGYGHAWFEGATAADWWQAILDEYGGDVLLAAETEAVNSSLFDLIDGYEEKYGEIIYVGEPVPAIAGIIRTGDKTMTIRASEKNDSILYTLASLPVMPLHYYGDEALYDYENNSFGFVKGELAPLREKDGAPLGCGEYSFEGFENGTATLEANAHYFAGESEYRLVLMKEE